MGRKVVLSLWPKPRLLRSGSRFLLSQSKLGCPARVGEYRVYCGRERSSTPASIRAVCSNCQVDKQEGVVALSLSTAAGQHAGLHARRGGRGSDGGDTAARLFLRSNRYFSANVRTFRYFLIPITTGSHDSAHRSQRQHHSHADHGTCPKTALCSPQRYISGLVRRTES